MVKEMHHIKSLQQILPRAKPQDLLKCRKMLGFDHRPLPGKDQEDSWVFYWSTCSKGVTTTGYPIQVQNSPVILTSPNFVFPRDKITVSKWTEEPSLDSFPACDWESTTAMRRGMTSGFTGRWFYLFVGQHDFGQLSRCSRFLLGVGLWGEEQIVAPGETDLRGPVRTGFLSGSQPQLLVLVGCLLGKRNTERTWRWMSQVRKPAM